MESIKLDNRRAVIKVGNGVTNLGDCTIAWQEKCIFGKILLLSHAGFACKFNMKAYIAKWLSK